MTRNILVVSAACAFLLVGCGGGSSSGDNSDSQSGMESEQDSNTDNTNILTGIFVDSAVEGASYSTASQSGTTNSAGEFNYLEGEQVIFTVGATALPSVAAAPQVSPVDMAAGSSNTAATTTNIARLLQSLDIDGNPDNGITISPNAAANAATINFDVSVDEFANNTDVINLVANSGSTTTTLISAEAANDHLNATLGTVSGEGGFSQSVLLSGNPWYSIRVFSDRLECGSRFSFNADGSFSGATIEGAGTGTYSLSESGLLTLETETFGLENWQLNELNEQDWSVNLSGENGGSHVVRVFSGRNAALEFSNGLGMNCETGLPDGDQQSSGIILDLRNSTWLESNETGCDGTVNTVRLEYSQTGFGAFISRAEDRGQGCVRNDSVFNEITFSEANATSAFILSCGGDGLCTFDELNREVLVPIGDLRNDCTQNGTPVSVNHRVSHEVGSNTITSFNCDSDDADVYVRQ